MTYNAQEISRHSGEPVELYTFQLHTTIWRFTSADEGITGGTNYFPSSEISCDEIEMSPELSKSGLSISVARDNPVAQLFRDYPPEGIVQVTIARMHRDDGEVITKWRGRILGCTWTPEGATLNSDSVSTSRRRMGLRRKFGPNCPYTLFDQDCKAIDTNYSVAGTVTGISGREVTVDTAGTEADGFFDGGSLSWSTVNGGNDSRMINSHAGGVLTLTYPAHGLDTQTSVVLLPGCDRTLSECDLKYENSPNHGGWMFLPDDNPFDGQAF